MDAWDKIVSLITIANGENAGTKELLLGRANDIFRSFLKMSLWLFLLGFLMGSILGFLLGWDTAIFCFIQ